MSEEVPIDEAARMALLLETEIQKKMAEALIKFMFADNVYFTNMVLQHIEHGQLPMAAMEMRRHLAQDMFRDNVFVSLLQSTVREVLWQNRETLGIMLREELERARVQGSPSVTTNSVHLRPFVKL